MAKGNNFDKVVVVTGASSGFGKGAALGFAEEGASLVLAARRGELLEDLAAECETRGAARALAVPTDVSIREDVANLADAAIDAFGCIDVWVNDAGVGAIGRFERIPIGVHEQVIKTDLFGMLYGSYYAYRQFIKQGNGILINIASELGRHTVPYYTSYTAAKHGVVGLSDSLRQEAKQNDLKDVHICYIMPSAHDTPFFDHAANYTGHEVQAPKPLHDPEDVIATIIRLAHDPRDKEIVGADGVVKILMKEFVPFIEEKMVSRQMHKTQYEDSPPAEDTTGSVCSPTSWGTDISAGRR